MKPVVTVTGIRPDFIRMSELFKKLDKEFNHILVHTGQHYDRMLSDVFFEELEIRKPDFNLGIGAVGKEHFYQTADVSVKTIELLRKESIEPSIILFLGDSNSVTVSLPLKKEGYTIGHIESGMRSGDKRMFEELNRTVCDHCSDLHFVYHHDYLENLRKENISLDGAYVVGNTIVEVCNKFKNEIMSHPKTKAFILMDIHRPENFKDKCRLQRVFLFANQCLAHFGVTVKCLKFGRTMHAIKDFGIDTGAVQFVDLMSYKSFLKAQYNSLFILSDSGTSQEEPALLSTPVIVPRDFTERPQSYWNGCSFPLYLDDPSGAIDAIEWVQSDRVMYTEWLGNGTTSDMIVEVLRGIL